jgi:hypothetical protein
MKVHVSTRTPTIQPEIVFLGDLRSLAISLRPLHVHQIPSVADIHRTTSRHAL